MLTKRDLVAIMAASIYGSKLIAHNDGVTSHDHVGQGDNFKALLMAESIVEAAKLNGLLTDEA